MRRPGTLVLLSTLALCAIAVRGADIDGGGAGSRGAADWVRDSARIRSADLPPPQKAEALAQLAVASGDPARIREAVLEIERMELAPRDKLGLQVQLQDQERRLRAGLPTEPPRLSRILVPRHHASPAVPYRPPTLAAPPPAAYPPSPAPPPAAEAQRPQVLISEDATGAWTSDGRRLLRQGPVYLDPATGRLCVTVGTFCSPQ